MTLGHPEEGNGRPGRPRGLFNQLTLYPRGHRLPSSYANPAPQPIPHERPAVPLAIGTNHYCQPHEICTCSLEATYQYVDTRPYRARAAYDLGPCPHDPSRRHYWVEMA